MLANYSVIAAAVFLAVAGTTGAVLVYSSAGSDSYVSDIGGVPEDEVLAMDFKPLVVPAMTDGRVYAYLRIDFLLKLTSESQRAVVARQAPRLHALLAKDFYGDPIRWLREQNGVDYVRVHDRVLLRAHNFLGDEVVDDVKISQIWLAHK